MHGPSFSHRSVRRISSVGSFNSARDRAAADPALTFKDHIAANLLADVVDNRNALSALTTPDGL